MDLGLERAGWECKWQVEIDPWCQRVLAKHWPDVPRYGDVKAVGDELSPVDLICGGFPCPPVSLASSDRRKGVEDERWLWPEFARIIRLVRPRFVIVENVPGLLSANGGAAMSSVLGDLAGLGFDSEWDRIPAALVGAPHLRNRIFIVAHARSERRRENAGSASSDEGTNEGRTPENNHVIDGDGEGGRTRFVADTEGESEWAGLRESATSVFGRGRSSYIGSSQDAWATEPDVGRVANGVPARVDRLRGLGNAVVPQVAEFIGRRLMEIAA